MHNHKKVKCLGEGGYHFLLPQISTPRQDRNGISTSVGNTVRVTGSQKSKMAAFNLKIRLSRLVDNREYANSVK